VPIPLSTSYLIIMLYFLITLGSSLLGGSVLSHFSMIVSIAYCIKAIEVLKTSFVNLDLYFIVNCIFHMFKSIGFICIFG